MERTESEATRRRPLGELWKELFESDHTEESLSRLFVEAKRAQSNTDKTDRERIELQVAVLYRTWLLDGRTTWMRNAILTNQDATLIQKVRAFIIWLGLGPTTVARG